MTKLSNSFNIDLNWSSRCIGRVIAELECFDMKAEQDDMANLLTSQAKSWKITENISIADNNSYRSNVVCLSSGHLALNFSAFFYLECWALNFYIYKVGILLSILPIVWRFLELILIVKSTIKRQPSGISSIRKAFMNFDGNLTLISLKGIDLWKKSSDNSIQWTELASILGLFYFLYFSKEQEINQFFLSSSKILKTGSFFSRLVILLRSFISLWDV